MSPSRPVVLVTGAARRVGAVIARQLHPHCDLALHYRSSADAMQALAAELEAARAGSVLTVRADLGDIPALPGLVEAVVARFGRLDHLVHNASSFHPTRVGEVDEAAFDGLFASNAKGPFFLSQAAAPTCARPGARWSACWTSTPSARCPITRSTRWPRPRTG